MDHIVQLHESLVNKTYCHGPYSPFRINDPKPRDIHKASVADRIIHHALYRALSPFFEQKFIFDSYSCRPDKGMHRAIDRFRDVARKVSRNHTRTCWVLKCDIRKCFASLNHEVLLAILRKYIADKDVLWLLESVIESFPAGLPLGNVTSQIFINIYLNELDQFVKRTLKMKQYIRYADDFVILHQDRQVLERLIPRIAYFVEAHLCMSLHPKKLFLETVASGVDFLGWVHFPHHRVLRTSTKHRMMRRLEQHISKEMVASYLGMLSHGNAYTLAEEVRSIGWFSERPEGASE